MQFVATEVVSNSITDEPPHLASGSRLNITEMSVCKLNAACRTCIGLCTSVLIYFKFGVHATKKKKFTPCALRMSEEKQQII